MFAATTGLTFIFLLSSLWTTSRATGTQLGLEFNLTISPPISSDAAAAADPFWLEAVQHQGKAAFNSNPTSYQVFRNVKVRLRSVCAPVILRK